jgi:putative spermidine/putrescine transport system permease protein
MRRQTPLLLILPAVMVLAIFLAAFASIIGVSLLTLPAGGATFVGPVSLHNYAAALSSEHARLVALETLVLSVKITTLTILLGFPLAYILARSPSRRVRHAILFGLVATFLSGGVTRAYAWMVILGNRGIVNTLLAGMGLPTGRFINNEFAVVVSVLNFVLPFFVLTLFGALQAIPETLEHAARNLGASRLQSFLRVTLPLAVPGLVTAGSLVFALSLAAFLFPQLLGGGRVPVIATLIFEKIQTDFDIPAAAALAVIFLALAITLLLVLGGLQRLVAAQLHRVRAA